MKIIQIRCFILAAQMLHFGNAAQQMNILPAAFGRHIRLLEDSLGVRLFIRSTRNVNLTNHGIEFLSDARDLLQKFEEIESKYKSKYKYNSLQPLKLGVIDGAAMAVIPDLLLGLRKAFPTIKIHLTEGKSKSLYTKLSSGSLDMILCRPFRLSDRFNSFFLLDEEMVLVVPISSHLAKRKKITIPELNNLPFILPDRKERPHSYAFINELFESNHMTLTASQIATEKQTIISLIAAGLGVSILPKYSSVLDNKKIKTIPLVIDYQTLKHKLSLIAVWPKEVTDIRLASVLATLKKMTW